MTVPNQAKLDKRLGLLFGKSILAPVDQYFQQLDEGAGMTYAIHWREYTLSEFSALFENCGFRVVQKAYLHTFEDRSGLSWRGKVKRVLARGAVRLCPAIARLREGLREAGALAVGMSGSGPTVFGVFGSEPEAASALGRLGAAVWARVARTRESR